jgi:hypothetical protein
MTQLTDFVSCAKWAGRLAISGSADKEPDHAQFFFLPTWSSSFCFLIACTDWAVRCGLQQRHDVSRRLQRSGLHTTFRVHRRRYAHGTLDARRAWHRALRGRLRGCESDPRTRDHTPSALQRRRLPHPQRPLQLGRVQPHGFGRPCHRSDHSQARRADGHLRDDDDAQKRLCRRLVFSRRYGDQRHAYDVRQ